MGSPFGLVGTGGLGGCLQFLNELLFLDLLPLPQDRPETLRKTLGTSQNRLLVHVYPPDDYLHLSKDKSFPEPITVRFRFTIKLSPFPELFQISMSLIDQVIQLSHSGINRVWLVGHRETYRVKGGA